MKVFTSVKELRAELDRTEQSGIGFVPTMGALHAGHRSLVERARRENATVVVSVFVNPTQFNDKNDLRHYPRTPEADRRLLEEAGADFVLMPSGRRDISRGRHPDFRFRADRQGDGGCDAPRTLQRRGAGRQPPVRHRAPGRAYFGEKDFQQIAVIKAMTAQLKLPVEIVGNTPSSAERTDWRSRRATRCSTRRTAPQRRTSTPRCAQPWRNRTNDPPPN